MSRECRLCSAQTSRFVVPKENSIGKMCWELCRLCYPSAVSPSTLKTSQIPSMFAVYHAPVLILVGKTTIAVRRNRCFPITASKELTHSNICNCYLFIYLFIFMINLLFYLFIIYSLTHSLTYLLHVTQSLTHSLTQLFVKFYFLLYFFIHLFIHLLIYFSIYLFICSVTQSLTQSLTLFFYLFSIFFYIFFPFMIIHGVGVWFCCFAVMMSV